jgi:hypothetical protein
VKCPSTTLRSVSAVVQSPANLRQGQARSTTERGLMDEIVDAADAGSAEDATGQQQELTISFDEFSWSAITEEARRLGVSTQELARFSVLYYLADLDSGRIARRLPSAANF